MKMKNKLLAIIIVTVFAKQCYTAPQDTSLYRNTLRSLLAKPGAQWEEADIKKFNEAYNYLSSQGQIADLALAATRFINDEINKNPNSMLAKSVVETGYDAIFKEIEGFNANLSDENFEPWAQFTKDPLADLTYNNRPFHYDFAAMKLELTNLTNRIDTTLDSLDLLLTDEQKGFLNDLKNEAFDLFLYKQYTYNDVLFYIIGNKLDEFTKKYPENAKLTSNDVQEIETFFKEIFTAAINKVYANGNIFDEDFITAKGDALKQFITGNVYNKLNELLVQNFLTKRLDAEDGNLAAAFPELNFASGERNVVMRDLVNLGLFVLDKRTILINTVNNATYNYIDPLDANASTQDLKQYFIDARKRVDTFIFEAQAPVTNAQNTVIENLEKIKIMIGTFDDPATGKPDADEQKAIGDALTATDESLANFDDAIDAYSQRVDKNELFLAKALEKAAELNTEVENLKTKYNDDIMARP